MTYQNKQIADVAQKLQKNLIFDDKSKILKSNQLKALYAQIPLLDPRKDQPLAKN